MKALSEFYPRILPYAPGCPEPLAAQCLVDAAIAFCDESLVLRQTLTPIAVTATNASYTIPDTTSTTLARIMSARIDGKLIAPLAVNDNTFLPATTPSSQPTDYYTTNVSGVFSINLYPTPDQAYTLKLEVATRPIRGAVQLEDDLLNFWIDGLAAGALARIKAIPAQSFTDPTGAREAAMVMAASVRKARIEGTVGRVRVSQAVKPRAFA